MAGIGTKGYVKLDTILRNLCLKRGDQMMNSYMTLLAYAAEGMMDLGMRMNIGSNVKTITLTPDSTGRINLPDDYMKYIKVGFRYNGNFIALGHNPKMAPLEVDYCGTYQPVEGGNSKGNPAAYDGTDQTVYDSDFIPYGIPVLTGRSWLNGRWTPPFGHAGGWSESGYFNINLETRTIDFSSDLNVDEILLKYESTGFSVDSDNMILAPCVIAIERYITYAEVFHKASTHSENRRAQELHRVYANAAIEAIKKVHGSSNAEMADAWHQNSGGAPRQ